MTDYVYELIVAPEGGSTGEALVRLMDSLNVLSRFHAVVIADVECNENRAWVNRPPFCTSPAELLEYARTVGQFDWATFFFFAQAPSQGEVPYQYGPLFEKAELTIRAVDDTYFYVYSPAAADGSRLAPYFRLEWERKPRQAIVHPF